ncbi:MBOAT family protein [bacterium]|nr:MAG: MBOAT family protein [bacterium]
MTVLSISFIICLVTAVLIAWILPRAYQLPAIAVFTALYMGYYAPFSLVILLLTSLLTYYVNKLIHYQAIAAAGSITILAVIFLLAKSFQNIFSVNFNQQIITLGLFFYILRQIHYITERHKKKLPEHTFLDYLYYLFFFPTLMAGPINLFPEFRRDIHRRRFDPEAISLGLERILYGYVKIVVLANWLVTGKMAVYIESISAQHISAAAYLDCVRYGLNLYFQFSGYSDIAIGLSLATGFRIIENFNHPYLAKNINIFWQRWHISLSKWCRDYIFMTVISISRKPILAVLSSMMVIGLWHELSPRYMVWALYHGCGIAVWHFFQHFKRRVQLPDYFWLKKGVAVFSIAFTMNFVILSFAITKSDSLADAFEVYLTIFSLGK